MENSIKRSFSQRYSDNMFSPSILAGTTPRASVSRKSMKHIGVIQGSAAALGSASVGADIVVMSSWLLKASGEKK